MPKTMTIGMTNKTAGEMTIARYEAHRQLSALAPTLRERFASLAAVASRWNLAMQKADAELAGGVIGPKTVADRRMAAFEHTTLGLMDEAAFVDRFGQQIQQKERGLQQRLDVLIAKQESGDPIVREGARAEIRQQLRGVGDLLARSAVYRSAGLLEQVAIETAGKVLKPSTTTGALPTFEALVSPEVVAEVQAERLRQVDPVAAEEVAAMVAAKDVIGMAVESLKADLASACPEYGAMPATLGAR